MSFCPFIFNLPLRLNGKYSPAQRGFPDRAFFIDDKISDYQQVTDVLKLSADDEIIFRKSAAATLSAITLNASSYPVVHRASHLTGELSSVGLAKRQRQTFAKRAINPSRD